MKLWLVLFALGGGDQISKAPPQQIATYRARMAEEVKNLGPKRQQLYSLVAAARRHEMNGDSVAAAAYSRKIVQEFPSSDSAGCSMIALAKYAKEPAERERLYRRAVAEHDNSWCSPDYPVGPAARIQLIRAYHESGRHEMAQKLLHETLKRSSDVMLQGKKVSDHLSAMGLIL